MFSLAVGDSQQDLLKSMAFEVSLSVPSGDVAPLVSRTPSGVTFWFLSFGIQLRELLEKGMYCILLKPV